MITSREGADGTQFRLKPFLKGLPPEALERSDFFEFSLERKRPKRASADSSASGGDYRWYKLGTITHK